MISTNLESQKNFDFIKKDNIKKNLFALYNIYKVTGRLLLSTKKQVFNVYYDRDCKFASSIDDNENDVFIYDRMINKALIGVTTEELKQLSPEKNNLQDAINLVYFYKKQEISLFSEKKLKCLKDCSDLNFIFHIDIIRFTASYYNKVTYTNKNKPIKTITIPYIDIEDLRKNIPIIAKELYYNVFNQYYNFNCIKFISTDTNNEVAFVQSSNSDKFIIKHISGVKPHINDNNNCLVAYIAKYSSVTIFLAKIKQASIDKKFLEQIGKDLNITPVVSFPNIASVAIDKNNISNLCFFKMSSLAQGDNLSTILSKNTLTEKQEINIFSRIAKYLARLHTVGGLIKVRKNKDKTFINMIHKHGHPHCDNWLIDISNPNNPKLFLIDWDLYSQHELEWDFESGYQNDFLVIDDYYNIRLTSKLKFKESYITEWLLNTKHLTDREQEVATKMLKNQINYIIKDIK